MTKTPIENYFEYVENVLGIKQVLFDRTAAVENSISSTVQSIPVLISVLNLNNYNEAENDLLYKMVAALKLNPETYLVIDLSLRSSYEPKHELVLVDQPKHSAQTIETYSPRVLLKSPALKKEAWTEMQKLLQKKI